MSNFYDEIIKLKNLLRRGWVIRFGNENIRIESDAEHIYSSIMLAIKVMHDKKLNLNQETVIKMLLVHELGEIDAGDFTPIDDIMSEEKHNREEIGVKRVAKVFEMEEFYLLWEDFEEQKTTEAKFAKMIDKLDCLLQVKHYSLLTNRPEVYEEFYNNAKDKIVGYEEYLK